MLKNNKNPCLFIYISDLASNIGAKRDYVEAKAGNIQAKFI